jgi:DNA invertase Pin-like site-specific DNA recombinase
MSAKPILRCAIYTRKSSDEGLDQAFNSLDAQFDACAAYIASQRHEGWRLEPRRFDDGGLSGGTLERPALQRLLAEIDAGRIGMVVVYKIDRLTRSLADFVRLVERLDAQGASFVSVTQAFNTATSMGRLTLNVLLSFAQFEREVTAERIRDKIAASKQKGLWMGGTLPLGYDRHPDPQRRELVVNAAEAETVRTLFRLYTEHANLRVVETEAARLGLRPKQFADATRRTRPPGTAFTRGQLHYLLTNPVYIGRIRHKDRDSPGQHAAIIEPALWDAVQARLRATRARPRGRSANPPASRPLTGKLRDETGDLLTPTHAQRRGRRFTYYVSHRLIAGGADPAGWRLPAAAIEAAIRNLVTSHLRDAAERHALLVAPDARQATTITHRLQHLIEQIDADPAGIGALVEAVELRAGSARIRLRAAPIAAALGVAPADLTTGLLAFDRPLALRRRGVETRIVTGVRAPTPDPVLIRVLAEARLWAAALQAGTSLTELATRTGHSKAYLRARLPLAFLAPVLQAAILDGRHSPDLSVARLIREGVPYDWADQQRQFGDRGASL